MKKILIIVAGILFISACNKYEIKDQNKGQAIDFRVALETKATEITTENLTEFYVTAFKGDKEDGSIYFENILFTKNDESGYFESDEKYYWPAEGGLRFYAYYPGSSDAGSSDAGSSDAGSSDAGSSPALNISGTLKTITNYEAVGDITKQIDIIIAKATGNKTDNQNGVELVFAHQLSQVEIKAVNNNAAYTYSIKGVKIANVNTVGSLDFSGTSTVWDSTTPGDYVIEYENAKPISSDPVTLMSNAMLIPQTTKAWVVNPEEVTPEETPKGGDTPAEQAEEGDTDTNTNTNIGSYISILVQINRVVDKQTSVRVYPKGADVEYAWMAAPVAFEWTAGYKYVITIDLGKGGGYEDPDNDVTNDDVEKVLGGQMKFSVSVDGWYHTGDGQNI